MHIGNILKNTADGSVLGAVVHTYPNKLIIFRNVNGLNPGIFKMPVEDLNNPMIVSAGTINQPEFEPIKKALLKYYRRGTLPESEKAVFGRIMEYAFPNGVPLFDDLAERMPDDATRAIRLADHLQPGKCLYINTVQSGPFGHLDNQCVYVLGGDEHGLWVCPHQSGSEFSTSYLPFKDRTVPKFWSVNRLLPGEVRDNRGAEYVGRFLAAKTQGGLANQITHADTRIKLAHDPETGRATVIMPQKWAGQTYDFTTGTIKPLGANSAQSKAYKLMGLGSPDTINDNEPYVGPPQTTTQTNDTLELGKDDIEHAKMAAATLAELNADQLAFQDKIERTGQSILKSIKKSQQTGGGAASDIADAWAGVDTIEPIVPDDKGEGQTTLSNQTNGLGSGRRRRLSSAEAEDLAATAELGSTPLPSDYEEDNGSETASEMAGEMAFNEADLEFLEDDEPIIELEKVQKIRQMPVPELEKVFKESIQKGHIYKQKLEKIPALLRDNPLYKDRIAKDVNVISLLKAQMTTESRMVIAQPADYHPMIETILRNDYTNHFLVPLVVTTKKLYLTKKDPISRDDLAGPTAAVEADFHKYMSEWCRQNAKGGIKKMVDINENLNRIMTEAAPHLPAVMSQLGLMVRFGEGIRPADTRNPDTTVKLKTTRAQEDIEYLAQATQAIRFGTGGRDFQLRNFAVDTQPFDSHVVLGPIGNYSNIPKTEYTIAEIEAMEEEVDKNIAAVGSIYNIAYMGDNVNLVGFVRPPVMNFLQGRGENLPSLASELSSAEDKGQIVIRYLDSDHPDSFEDGQSESLEDPDKFIVYLFQDPGASTNSGPTLTDDVLRAYLGRIIPKFDDITRLFTGTYRVEQPGDLERLIEILYKFDYIIPHREGLSLAASRTQPETHLRTKADANWENTQSLIEVEDRIVRAMVAYNNKMDKIHRLKVIQNAKKQERDELSNHKSGSGIKDNQHELITPGLIELADKIYGEQYSDIAGTGEFASLDENKMDYYAHKPDRAQYINLLLRKTSLSRLQELLSITELESSLAVLKSKYEASGRALPNDLSSRVAPETLEKTQLGKCAAADGQGGIGGRKPRILRYPSLARLKEDNAKVATTPAGDLVLEGDYAMVEEAGKKLIFRRETLNDGDFWIGQPISVLEQLLFKKRATCAATGSGATPTQSELDTARAAMRLPEEQLAGTDSDPDKTKNLQLGKDGQPTSECIFDLSRLQCLPVDIVDMDRDLADIQARIMDVNGQLAFARALPPLLAECEKSLVASEKEIRNYNHGVVLVEKYYTALIAQQQKELEALVKRRRDCPHFAVVQYLEGLLNLSDQERYMLVKEIINRFQNQEQASRLDLLEVAPDNKHNNIECHICSQTLLCKHYLYALELIENSENGWLDDKAIQAAYGEVLGGTYYCRACGAPLGNTEVLDIEEFEKDGGKEGVHVKTREVMEDIGVIERQKAAVDKIITAAINDETDDDMKTKLRLYKLAKDLLGLAVMSVEDELAIVNFMKTYEFIPRQTFYNLIYRRFLQAQGGRAQAVNKAAIDTKANEFFWQHTTCDILGHLLIIIQTSNQTYTVFNKLCATNNYMGWPLLSVGGSSGDIPEEDQGGIELMFCVIKQIALLPEFHMLGSNGGTEISGLRNQLVKRITEQIRNNEMVRTRLDRALDTKYNQISLLEEFRLSATNYWPSYRPVMAGTIPGGVKWTPIRDLDMTAVQDWSAKAHSAMVSAGRDNIAYQSQVLTHNLTSVIEKEAPANRIMLVNTVANSCCPIDYSVLMKSGMPEDRANNDATGPRNTHTQHPNSTSTLNKSKYLNPEINYYMNLERENEPIRNALRRIGEYSAMIKILERAVAPPRVRLTFPYVSKDIIPKDMTIALEGDELQAFFLKFIDEGPFKGAEHIFDPFGRCIVSGALKRDVAAISYTQTDFDRLLSVVERQKVIKDPTTLQTQASGALGLAFGSSHILIQLVAAIEKNPITNSGSYINLEQLVEMAPRVNELLEHNARFALDLENLTKDFTLLSRLASECHNPKLGDKIAKRIGHLKVILGQMEKLAVARLNELMLANIGWGFREFGVGAKQTNRVIQQMGGAAAKGPKSGLIQDYKKEYYGLITMIDTERQSEIAGVVDIIGTNKKAELGLEQTLINLGALRDISRDLRELMDQQERIVPHYEYVNHDREQEIQHYIIRAEFIRKLLNDIRLLVVQLKNEAWMDYKTAADVPDYLREFYKYKDAAQVFRDKLASITGLITGLGGLLDGISEGSIFGAEVVAGLLSYVFSLMLGGMISRVSDGQPHANQTITLEVPQVIPHDDNPTGIAITNSENEFDFVAAVDRAKGRAEPSAAEQGVEHMVIINNQEETNTNPEEEELGLYPEFVAEPAPNDPIAAHEEYSSAAEMNLGAAAKEVKTTQRRVVIDFVRDVVLFAQRMEHIYNQMNLDRIREQMARTQEKQTKLNLAAPKFLKQEGMEDDYRMVMNMINLGFMEYKDLNSYMRDHYGDDVFRQGEEEMDTRPIFDGGDDYDGGDGTGDGPDRDEEARRNKYGLDNAEMAEMGYVGAQEDMEEMDYGYIGVDEA